MLYIYRRQEWRIRAGDVLSSIFIFDRLHQLLRHLVSEDLFYNFQPFFSMSSYKIIYRYFRRIFFSDKLHSLVAIAQAFTSRRHTDTCTDSNHAHFLHVSNARRKFNSSFFFTEDCYFVVAFLV